MNLLATFAAVSALASPNVASLQLPASLNLYGIEADGNGLLLTGNTTHGTCAYVRVEESPLRVTSRGTRACSRASTEHVHPVLEYDRKSFGVRVRIARAKSVGPIVMTFQNISDTKLEYTYGPGTLWLFDTATPRGAEVLQVSTKTGRVENVVRMPKIFRPFLAADEDGLWLAIAPNGGAASKGAVPVYRVAFGARAPVVVHRGGRAALWIVAAGHAVWVDVLTGQHGAEIWRFDGPAGSAHPLASAHGLNTWAASVDTSGTAIWTVREVPMNRTYFGCDSLRVYRIDGRTGKQSLAANIQMPASQCYGVTDGTFADGAFSFLYGPRLYSVR